MKKYRLKQWYPSLPPYWKKNPPIVKKDTLNGGYYASAPSGRRYLSEQNVENNPEFWEEVQDPEYTDNDIDRAFKNSLVQGDYDRHNTLVIHVPTFKDELKKKS